MHSFVLADASHQELPTTFIETKLHFNLFLVSSISVSDLFSLFLSFAFDVLISCALLILIHPPPPSSLLDAIRMFPKTTGWTELNCMHKFSSWKQTLPTDTRFSYWIAMFTIHRDREKRRSDYDKWQQCICADERFVTVELGMKALLNVSLVHCRLVKSFENGLTVFVWRFQKLLIVCKSMSKVVISLTRSHTGHILTQHFHCTLCTHETKKCNRSKRNVCITLII